MMVNTSFRGTIVGNRNTQPLILKVTIVWIGMWIDRFFNFWLPFSWRSISAHRRLDLLPDYPKARARSKYKEMEPERQKNREPSLFLLLISITPHHVFDLFAEAFESVITFDPVIISICTFG